MGNTEIPELKCAMALGVNADGKTVKNPVDGFTKVPGTKPFRFAMAAFSTDQADKIEKKLLFNHTQSTGKSYKDSDDGDLIKASRLAQEIREKEPDAEFVFKGVRPVLCKNG